MASFKATDSTDTIFAHLGFADVRERLEINLDYTSSRSSGILSGNLRIPPKRISRCLAPLSGIQKGQRSAVMNP